MKKISSNLQIILIIGAIVILIATIIAISFNPSNTNKSKNTVIEADANPNCTHDETYTEPEPKLGRYYLNGDTNNYYFEILEGHKIQLVGNLYEIFSEWNPQNEEAIQEDVQAWSQPRDFLVMTMHRGGDKPLIAVDWEFDESGELIKLASGPVMKDENTLTSWGIEGDFIFVE